ncbi:MAG: triose-phosphate isomerase [Patescibacteria group bacterium]|jgi:triosephosphate isomerase
MKTVIGNWKMHLGIRESVALARGIVHALRGKEQIPELVVCPSFTALSEVNKVFARSRVSLGAQDVGFDRVGPYTGAISTTMLTDVGCQYVIVGHSERRRFFGETNELVARKLESIFDSKLTPIFCVGESFSHQAGDAEKEVQKQLDCLREADFPKNKKMIIAYEPVWSVGTGKPAAIHATIDMIDHIRELLISRFGISEANLRIVYGGSIDPKNAHQYLRESAIDGVMVGGESIRLQSFEKIIETAVEVITAQST